MTRHVLHASQRDVWQHHEVRLRAATHADRCGRSCRVRAHCQRLSRCSKCRRQGNCGDARSPWIAEHVVRVRELAEKLERERHRLPPLAGLPPRRPAQEHVALHKVKVRLDAGHAVPCAEVDGDTVRHQRVEEAQEAADAGVVEAGLQLLLDAAAPPHAGAVVGRRCLQHL